MSISKFTKNSTTFINIVNADEKDVKFLDASYDFPDLDLARILIPENKRASVDIFEKCVSVILEFPVFDDKTKAIRAEEIDLIIGENVFIVAHKNKIQEVNNFFENLKNEHLKARKKYLIFYEFVNNLLKYTHPMIENIKSDVDNLEHNIFSDTSETLAKEITRLRLNIIDFSRIINPQVTEFREFITDTSGFFSPSFKKIYARDLANKFRGISEVLKAEDATIKTLHWTNEISITNKTQRIILILTIVTAVTLPMATIPGIYGMNIELHQYTDDPFFFWFLVFFMLGLSIIILLIFKIKKWF